MGRGDIRTKRGKIFRGTKGVTRTNQRKGNTDDAAVEAAKETKETKEKKKD